MIRRTAEQDQLNELFHKAWGQAKGSPEYDKEVWRQLDMVVSPIIGSSAPKTALAMTRSAAEKDRLNELFHKAWGQAKGSPEHDKDVWRQLSRIFSSIVGETAPETTNGEQLALETAARIAHAIAPVNGWAQCPARIGDPSMRCALAWGHDDHVARNARTSSSTDSSISSWHDSHPDTETGYSWGPDESPPCPLPPTLAEAQAEWRKSLCDMDCHDASRREVAATHTINGHWPDCNANQVDPERGPALSGRSGRVEWVVGVDGGVAIRVGDCRFNAFIESTGECRNELHGDGPLADMRECLRLAEAADGGTQSPSIVSGRDDLLKRIQMLELERDGLSLMVQELESERAGVVDRVRSEERIRTARRFVGWMNSLSEDSREWVEFNGDWPQFIGHFVEEMIIGDRPWPEEQPDYAPATVSDPSVSMNIYKIIDGEVTYVYAQNEDDAKKIYCEEMLEGPPQSDMKIDEFPRDKWADFGIVDEEGTRTTFNVAVAEFGSDTTPRILCSTCFS